MTHTITREFLRLHRACYDDTKIATLIPLDGLPLVDVLKLDIPSSSRLWVATLPGACPAAIRWEWQARMVERALARVEKPDPRSLAVVQLLRRLASGEAIPREQRAAARDAAWAAYAATADAWAARAYACDAAWAAAWAAATVTAYDAAYAATAATADAAYAATAAAAAAAYDAWAATYDARAAARDAAYDAEENQQIADLIELLTKDAP